MQAEVAQYARLDPNLVLQRLDPRLCLSHVLDTLAQTLAKHVPCALKSAMGCHESLRSSTSLPNGEEGRTSWTVVLPPCDCGKALVLQSVAKPKFSRRRRVDTTKTIT